MYNVLQMLSRYFVHFIAYRSITVTLIRGMKISGAFLLLLTPYTSTYSICNNERRHEISAILVFTRSREKPKPDDYAILFVTW